MFPSTVCTSCGYMNVNLFFSFVVVSYTRIMILNLMRSTTNNILWWHDPIAIYLFMTYTIVCQINGAWPCLQYLSTILITPPNPSLDAHRCLASCFSSIVTTIVEPCFAFSCYSLSQFHLSTNMKRFSTPYTWKTGLLVLVTPFSLPLNNSLVTSPKL